MENKYYVSDGEVYIHKYEYNPPKSKNVTCYVFNSIYNEKETIQIVCILSRIKFIFNLNEAIFLAKKQNGKQ